MICERPLIVILEKLQLELCIVCSNKVWCLHRLTDLERPETSNLYYDEIVGSSHPLPENTVEFNEWKPLKILIFSSSCVKALCWHSLYTCDSSIVFLQISILLMLVS